MIALDWFKVVVKMLLISIMILGELLATFSEAERIWGLSFVTLQVQEEAIRNLVTLVWSEDPEFAQEFM